MSIEEKEIEKEMKKEKEIEKEIEKEEKGKKKRVIILLLLLLLLCIFGISITFGKGIYESIADQIRSLKFEKTKCASHHRRK